MIKLIFSYGCQKSHLIHVQWFDECLSLFSHILDYESDFWREEYDLFSREHSNASQEIVIMIFQCFLNAMLHKGCVPVNLSN